MQTSLLHVGALVVAFAGAFGCTRREQLVGGGEEVCRFEAASTDPGGAIVPEASRFELCNNGVDDDLQGGIDDGCTCAVGDAQSCHPGRPAIVGVGACARGTQACVASGPRGAWGECVGAIDPSEETCGDGVDDDCDGAVDESCPCEHGATQPCTTSARGLAGIGACVAGEQTCDRPAGTIDGVEVFGWSDCAGSIAPAREECNAIDDDCDGAVDEGREICDLEDDDCDGAIDEGDACAALPPAYALTRFWSAIGGGILPASAPLHDAREIDPADACGPGEIAIEDVLDHVRCVAPPPACAPGARFEWSGDAWACRRCDLIVQFGGLFDGERTCAERPTIECEEGTVPTYRVETRTWVCDPTCSNGTYDRAAAFGELVCVPC